MYLKQQQQPPPPTPPPPPPPPPTTTTTNEQTNNNETKNIKKIKIKFKLQLFGDDTSLYCIENEHATTAETLNEDLESIHECSTSWGWEGGRGEFSITKKHNNNNNKI